MRKIASVLLSVAALLVTFNLAAQTNQETRPLQSFNAVKVSNAIEAELVKGDKNEIQIAASGIGLDRVSTAIDKQTLEVKITGSNLGGSSVKVTITYRDINRSEERRVGKEGRTWRRGRG